MRMLKAMRLSSLQRFIESSFLVITLALLAGGNPYDVIWAQSFVIGVSVPLTGDPAAIDHGAKILNALNLFVEEQNNNKGVLGRYLELRVVDGAHENGQALSNINALIADPAVLAIVGSWDDSISHQIADTAEKNKIPLFAPAMDDPTFARSKSWVWGVNIDNEEFGKRMALYMQAIDHRKEVVIVHAGAQRFIDQARYFKAEAEKLGVKVTLLGLKEINGNTVHPTFTSELKALINPTTDALVVLSYSELGADIIKNIRDGGIDLPIYGNDKFANDIVVTHPDPKYHQALYSSVAFTYDFASLSADLFVKMYQDKYHKMPNLYGAFAYDGMKLLTEAMITQGATRAKINEFLAGRTSSANALRGITGNLFFIHQYISRDPIVRTIEQGKFKLAYQQIQKVSSLEDHHDIAQEIKEGNALDIDGEQFHIIKTVFAGIDFYRINNLAYTENRFDIEFFLWLKWRGNLDYAKFIFSNQTGDSDTFEKTIIDSNFDEKDMENAPQDKFIVYKIKGTFLYSFDAKHFPFEEQHIPIELIYEDQGAQSVMLVADRDYFSKAPLTLIYPREWTYEGRIDSSGTFSYGSNFGKKIGSLQAESTEVPAYRVNIRLKRITLPYWLTIFLPLLFMMFINFFGYYGPLETDEIINKKALTLAFLAGLILFHMTVSALMPRVGYIVLTDLFFFFSYIVVCLQIAFIAILQNYFNTNREETAIRIQPIFNVILFLFNVVGYGGLFAYVLFNAP